MKRMRIDQCLAQPTAVADFDFAAKRKTPLSGRSSPMLLLDESVSPTKPSHALRRKKMMEMLQNQLSEYKSQYTSISEGPGRSLCSDFTE